MESGYNQLTYAFFHIYFIHSYSVQWTIFVRFISADDSLNSMSSLGKKRKISQGTDDMTANCAGMFIMISMCNQMVTSEIRE